MKKLIQVEENEYYCDNCGRNLLKDYLGIPITIDFGYGHILDSEQYHFCHNHCLLVFINEEIKKGE